MKKFIVCTSINPPTQAIKKFDNFKDWTLIVVGDLKTPKNYKLKNGIFLNKREQNLIDKKLSDLIGWNCIERRNLGILLAKKYNADIIALVDDDNIPYKNWGKNLLVGKKKFINTYEVKTPVFDPISVTKYKNLWHRGFPLNLLDQRNAKLVGKKKIMIDVQADFWDGDPDIDAICRLSKMPVCGFEQFEPFGSNQIAPFNSQNTFLHRDVIPYYSVLPHAGRMDDIWGAYIVQKYFPGSVVYNKATVYQDRNEQDLVTNLENEVIGYRGTLNLINDLDNYYNHLPEKTQKYWSVWRGQFEQDTEL